MARVNVYLPDDLAEQARSAGVNVSAIAQDALRATLAAADTNRWLDRLEQHDGTDLNYDRIIRALDDARDEVGA